MYWEIGENSVAEGPFPESSICFRQESQKRPIAFQSGALDRLYTGTFVLLLSYLASCKREVLRCPHDKYRFCPQQIRHIACYLLRTRCTCWHIPGDLKSLQPPPSIFSEILRKCRCLLSAITMSSLRKSKDYWILHIWYRGTPCIIMLMTFFSNSNFKICQSLVLDKYAISMKFKGQGNKIFNWALRD